MVMAAESAADELLLTAIKRLMRTDKAGEIIVRIEGEAGVIAEMEPRGADEEH
jgi:hypothetical protein